jgi:hypothetical protein
MEYFVASNLLHDGKVYYRGDIISLDGLAAMSLLTNGVIQTEPIEEEPAPAPEPVADTQPEVAGKAMETGEPSIDGREPERTADNATDVTPVVEDMKALSPDVRAKTPAKDTSRKAKTPEKKAEKTNNQAAEPEFDPSANL